MTTSTTRRPLRTAAGAVVLAVLLAACSADAPAAERGDTLRVIATTEIIADIAREVGGDRVDVDSLVPEGGDPHSYEPTPADAAEVTRADIGFTNHLLLEEQALVRAIDANLPEDAVNVSLAEASESYGAHVIPLVENLALDVLWLGLRVRGEGVEHGADRSSRILARVTDVEGPGDLVAYLTHALGEPEVYASSADGLDEQDVATLPPAAHTHLNWAFTAPGVYDVTIAGELDAQADGSGAVEPMGEATFRFAVGVDPMTVVDDPDTIVLDDGHTDLTVDIDRGEVYAYTDLVADGEQTVVPAADVVIDVPNRALTVIPEDPRFGFLGVAGDEVFQLPQAVIGKHVHGEIDPHLWQDVVNAKAYAQLLRDTFVAQDPEGADVYEAETDRYLDELDELDAEVRATLATIPPDRRQLVTTHDAFGYLAHAYDLTVAGFVVPNPAQEPSAEQVRRLGETITNLEVPAVFLEPNLVQRASVLRQVATDRGVEVCTIYGDAFGDEVDSYVAMMRHNATELARCLGGSV